MKKIITIEKINALQKARESVLGTKDYYIYDCECDYKDNKGTWKFIGWSYPKVEGNIKIVKGKVWLYCNEMFGEYRYALSEDCIKFLGLNNL